MASHYVMLRETKGQDRTSKDTLDTLDTLETYDDYQAGKYRTITGMVCTTLEPIILQ